MSEYAVACRMRYPLSEAYSFNDKQSSDFTVTLHDSLTNNQLLLDDGTLNLSSTRLLSVSPLRFYTPTLLTVQGKKINYQCQC